MQVDMREYTKNAGEIFHVLARRMEEGYLKEA
jgi:hypothetical protein